MSEAVGAVTGLWRFPVKSMRGEKVETAEVTDRGVVGDRERSARFSSSPRRKVAVQSGKDA
jgi:uncharacterized protein YcbX